MKTKMRMFHNIIFAVRYVAKFKRTYVVFCLGMSLLSIVAPITEVWGPKQIVDQLSVGAPIASIVGLIVALSGLELLKTLLFAIYNSIYLPIAQSRLKGCMNLELFRKASALEMKYFETPEFYDQYTRALSEADSRFIAIIDSLSMLLGTVIYLGTLGGIIIGLDALMLGVIVITVVSMFFMRLRQSRISYRYDKEITPIDRKMSYLRKVFYENSFSKEVRVFNMAGLLFRKYIGSEEERSGLLKKKGKAAFGLSCLTGSVRILLLMTFIMIYLALRIESGRLTVGSFLALFLAVTQATNQIIEMIGSISGFYEHSMYIENFRKIMDIRMEEAAAPDGADQIEGGVYSLEDVTFSYPLADGKSLSHVSLRIGKGEKIALVGPNGAGKSTLAKIILGLYEPSGGRVLYDWMELNAGNAPYLREKVGVMFQDFSIYAFSIAGNILFREVKDGQDEQTVVNALERVGLYEKVSRLKRGIHTVLSKEFDEDGITFSGGELQKIALARIFVKDRDAIILDEPSSALDPIAENEFFEYIMEITRGKTVLYITHRLTTIRLATRILYIENGEICEDGTFEELMSLNGKFARMYRIQAEKYISV